MLRHKGFEVHEAANGSAAIGLLRAGDWKILLDMTIPGHSSQEIVAEASRVSPDVKVILTSAYSEEMMTGQVHGSVICGFIRKPFK